MYKFERAPLRTPAPTRVLSTTQTCAMNPHEKPPSGLPVTMGNADSAVWAMGNATSTGMMRAVVRTGSGLQFTESFGAPPKPKVNSDEVRVAAGAEGNDSPFAGHR